jgi:hypothetical protein
MSRNSKAKRDKNKKAQKKRNPAATTSNVRALDVFQVTKGLQNLFDPSKLTAPIELNDDIRAFCRTISDLEPFFLDVEPEPWSRQSCCNLNVQEYIKRHGGRMICGYKIWYHPPKYIEAERHAIWEKDGEYRDLAFNADGEDRILFLPDSVEKQSAMKLNNRRFRWGKDVLTRRLIEIQESSERGTLIKQVSDDIAWDTMLTYEAWQKGERMKNVIQVPVYE